MHFECHPVDDSFFDTAPMRFRHQVDLDATAAKVFAIFDDENSWPKWFKAIHKVEWTSPRPHGVGSTRTVTLAAATVFEHFYCWEPDRRCAFYLTGASMPLAHALAEDYLLEEIAPGKTPLHVPRRHRAAPAGGGRRPAVAHVLRRHVQERLRAPAELCPRSLNPDRTCRATSRRHTGARTWPGSAVRTS